MMGMARDVYKDLENSLNALKGMEDELERLRSENNDGDCKKTQRAAYMVKIMKKHIACLEIEAFKEDGRRFVNGLKKGGKATSRNGMVSVEYAGRNKVNISVKNSDPSSPFLETDEHLDMSIKKFIENYYSLFKESA